MTLAKSAVTREAILEAARKAFARKGYSGTSVTDITEGLHVTRANFYYYFRDKKELFVELGTATYRESLAVINAVDKLDRQPDLSQVEGWVATYFQYLGRNGAFVVRSMEDSPDDPEFRANVARLHKRSARQLGKYISARSGFSFSSPVALGISIMAMLERSWLLAHTAVVDSDPTSAIQSNAEILMQLMRRGN